MSKKFVLDIEGDNLYPYVTKIWTVIAKEVDTDNKLIVHPFRDRRASDDLLDFLLQDKNPLIGFHNGLGYDLWAMWKLMGLDFRAGPDKLYGERVRWFDTLFASQFLWPDRPGHSLEDWGERFGFHKIDYRARCIELNIIPSDAPKGAEFRQWHPEMDVYCDRDVEIEEKLVKKLLSEVVNQGNAAECPARESGAISFSKGYRRGQKSFWLMQAQSFSGWEFDRAKAQKMEPEIQQMLDEIRSDVEPQLPPRPLKKGEMSEYKFPAKPWKKDGTFSSHMEKFIEKHSAKQLDRKGVLVYGQRVLIEPNAILDVKVPMNIEDQDAMKNWFLDLGWEPTFWNFKKDEFGKPLRGTTGQLIKTSPKIQESKKICPNLEEMDIPLVKQVVKFLSLRNRLGVMQGWLSHQRLDYDGRLPTSSTGIAATHRQKHATVVNVPKAQDDVLLGKEFRSLFIVENGFEIAAADASGLENRVAGHFTFKYDNGEYARLLLDGDCHSNNAKIWFPKETKKFDIHAHDFEKDHPEFKPYRSRSKNGVYAITYGCSPPKLAKTLGKPESDGQELYDAFWEMNPGIGLFRDALTAFWEKGGKKTWIPSIDGTRIYTRKKNAILNSLFQSAGAIIMDYAGCFMDTLLGETFIDQFGRPYYRYKGYIVRRIGYFHDELEYECQKGIGHEVSQLIVECIRKAGIELKMRVPLEGEGKVGLDWAEVH